MPCAFCAIVADHQLANVVHADDVAVAFLDLRPVFKGHVLVVPTSHVPTMVDLPETGEFFARVKLLTAAVETGLGADGVFMAINHRVSQSVPHLHTHLIPRHKGDGLRGFFWPRTRYEQGEAVEFAARIRQAVRS